MKDKEIIKHFAEEYDDLYIVEYVSSSILPKDLAISEFKNLNKKCIDEARLYKIEEGEIILVQKN